jgi:hypothetical protein
VRIITVATEDAGRLSQLAAAFSGLARCEMAADAGVKALPPQGPLERARFVFRRTRTERPVGWVFAEATDPRRGIVLMTPLELIKVFRGAHALARARAYLASLPMS